MEQGINTLSPVRQEWLRRLLALPRRPRTRRSDTRGVVAVEFAFAAGPFLVTTFFTIALSLHLFEQEALDAALHLAVRQVQTGNAQNLTNGSAFVTNYVCPNVSAVLNCSNISVNIQQLNFSSGQDYYNYTGTGLPVTGGTLNLSNYASSTFCNSAPNQFILVSAVYTSASILGSLLPHVFSVTYNGKQVDALLSQVAAVTENYPVQAGSGSPAPSC